MHARAISFLAIPFLLVAFGCGGDGKAAPQELATVSGRVVAGPVSGAAVSVLPLLNTGALGAPLGIGTSDPQGFFSIEVPGYVGAAVILTRGGWYVDEATGDTVVAENLEMASLAILTGQGDHTAHVTVATTIAARRAMVLATDPTVDALDAFENGVAMVEEYYGFVGILDTVPADLTAGPVPPGPAAEYGALNAGFSQMAADRGLYLWSLISSLAEDASDGTFDSGFYAGSIYVEGTYGEQDLDHTAGGLDLIDAIGSFTGGPRNASGLTTADLSIDSEIERHVQDDPAFAVCVCQPRIDDIAPLVGPVGEPLELTLYGRFPDLDGVSLVVTFDGIPATIVDRGEEEIAVIAPARAAAGKVDVAVTCTATRVHGIAPKAFEYYVPNLVPVITKVAPDRGPSAGGTLLEVTGQNFDPIAIVEVGGSQARTIARLGRTGMVVVVPPGSGTVDITVRQSDTTSAPYATIADAYSYFGQGGEEPQEYQLDGPWKAYGISHQFPDAVMLSNSDVVFAGGTMTQSGSAWVATPENPEGTTTTVSASGVFRAFADGTLWLSGPTEMRTAGTALSNLSPVYTSRSFLSQERDVFVVANDGNTVGPMWLGVGMRRASGMSVASLTGTWYLGLLSHAYAMGGEPRTVSSAWGTAEFDGAGQGSARLVIASVPAGGPYEDSRATIGGSLSYTVATDGTFMIQVVPEDGTPFAFEGSLTQAADLGVGVSVSGKDARFLMMVPSPTGFGEPYLQGSWYGGGLSYSYEPYDRGSWFGGETTRMLVDGKGAGLSEVNIWVTSEEDENDGVNTEIHEGGTTCTTAGFLYGGPDDLFGFIGSSRRFAIFVPANLDARVDVRPVEFMGASLLLRRPATYSSWTIDDSAYNAVGITTEYAVPGYPLSLQEENTSFLTRLNFTADAVANEEESSLIGLAREPAYARFEKTVRRWDDGSIDVDFGGEFPEFRGPYAVFGDGRILMSVAPDMSKITASGEEILEEVVGELTGNADLILFRNAVNPERASAFIVLARAGNPTINGVYMHGAISFFYPDSTEAAAACFGQMALDQDDGMSAGSVAMYFESPTEVERGWTSWEEGYFDVSDGIIGFLDHPAGRLAGIAAPDGSAIFLVDLDDGNNTTLLIGVEQPGQPVQSAGSYRISGFAHQYLGSSTPPVPAMRQVLAGAWRITNRLDTGYVTDIRTNTFDHVDRRAELFADQDLAVNLDGSIVWPGGYSSGWFSVNGRHAFLMTTDFYEEEIYPGAINLRFLTR